MKLRLVFFAGIASLLACSAAAQNDDFGVIYDNGATNGTIDAWTINGGLAVSNSFPATLGLPVVQVEFAAWLFPGDILQTAEVSITSSEFGGATYFDEVLHFYQTGCVTNQLGFSVCNETSDFFNDVTLQTGTYWLNLQNATVNTGDPVYWDENSGPSHASESSIGTIPSESFTVIGSCVDGKSSPGCGPPPTSPEPSSILLFGSGVLAIFGSARRFLR